MDESPQEERRRESENHAGASNDAEPAFWRYGLKDFRSLRPGTLAHDKRIGKNDFPFAEGSETFLRIVPRVGSLDLGIGDVRQMES